MFTLKDSSRPPCPPFSSLSSSPGWPRPSAAWLCLCSSSWRLSSSAARVLPWNQFTHNSYREASGWWLWWWLWTMLKGDWSHAVVFSVWLCVSPLVWRICRICSRRFQHWSALWAGSLETQDPGKTEREKGVELDEPKGWRAMKRKGKGDLQHADCSTPAHCVWSRVLTSLRFV